MILFFSLRIPFLPTSYQQSDDVFAPCTYQLPLSISEFKRNLTDYYSQYTHQLKRYIH